MRVLLFGLSGNPPTGLGGHQGIVSHCAGLPRYNQVSCWLVYYALILRLHRTFVLTRYQATEHSRIC